jgi:hypothetical protein
MTLKTTFEPRMNTDGHGFWILDFGFPSPGQAGSFIGWAFAGLGSSATNFQLPFFG